MNEIIETITVEGINKINYLWGKKEKNLKLIEKEYKVTIMVRDTLVKISGNPIQVTGAIQFVNDLLLSYDKGIILNDHEFKKFLSHKAIGQNAALSDILDKKIEVYAPKKYVYTKTNGQKNYINAINKNDLVFCIGPAGTGKTYLSVAMAVTALKQKKISRIILSRPAIEAGESLGYLPGDLKEKISPFLRPLYDALYEMMGYEMVYNCIEKNIIEVSPLAYMRGRTLNDAFIILDEAQNVTAEQMKMFLTRLGFNSKAVVTGDITQVDLPKTKNSGLIEVQKILKDISGIEFVYLNKKDIVRHELVQKIVQAYEAKE